jgi:hypothetical protein
MPFHQADTVRYYTFASLDAAGVRHGVFTRQGGVSPQPWASLNLGGTVGDDPANVAANRERAFRALARPLDGMYDAWLVHGNDVLCADAPHQPHAPHPYADAILTDQPHVTLFMRFADCVPIGLYDPRRKVVGLVHAGWPGTVKHVAAAAVETMQARYNSHPADILAVIGPSIAVHHYPVGATVIEPVQAAFGSDAPTLLPAYGQATHFDLWAANRLILEQAGVRQIETCGLCTACHTDDWYSHRAENGKTGRFGMILHL